MVKQASDDLFHAGHRERLKERLLNDTLTSDDKLELLLTYAMPRRDVRPVARALMQRFGNLYFVLSAPIEALTQVKGVGRNIALIIKLVSDLTTISYREKMKNRNNLTDTFVLQEYLRKILVQPTVEEIHVLYMDENGWLLLDEMHSRGTFDSSNVYPEQIARNALNCKARKIIFAHNHPMSDNPFSQQDIEFTEYIAKYLQVFNIDVVDHFVVTSHGTVYSLSESVWARKSSFFNK